MFPRSSLKTFLNCYTWLLNPSSHIYVGLTLKTAYIGMCAKGQIILEFSLMWIQLTCLLAFHMPWDHSDSTFHYPIEALYKEPFGHIEEEEFRSKKTIVHCCRSLLILESASLCLFGALFVLPKIAFACELAIEGWRIEVVEAQVQDSVSPIHRHADRGCIHCNLWFHINRNIFSCPMMYVWMIILSMDDSKCVYIVDYIC